MKEQEDQGKRREKERKREAKHVWKAEEQVEKVAGDVKGQLEVHQGEREGAEEDLRVPLLLSRLMEWIERGEGDG